MSGRAVLLGAVAACLGLAGCGQSGRGEAPAAATGSSPPAQQGSTGGLPVGAGEPPAAGVLPAEAVEGLRTIPVTVYFLRADALGLAGEERSIFATSAELDRMKQTIAALLEGPSPASGLQAVLPRGTPLRELFLDGNGVAYVDFGQELLHGMPPGSTAEVFAVGALANTLAHNFPAVRAVRILVAGEEVDTLTGHLDLTRPVPVDPTLIRPLQGSPGPASGSDSDMMPADGGPT